jgi:hypothetical protein
MTEYQIGSVGEKITFQGPWLYIIHLYMRRLARDCIGHAELEFSFFSLGVAASFINIYDYYFLPVC